MLSLSAPVKIAMGWLEGPTGDRARKDDLAVYFDTMARAGVGAIESRDALFMAIDHPALFKSSLYTGAPLWVAGAAPELPLPCRAKVRYRQPDQACSIQPSGDGLRVLFEQPQRAVTPGQSVVFYQGERCLGGAVIERAAP